MIAKDAYSLPPFERFFAGVRELYERLGVRTLGDPSGYFLAPDQILDTPYHANIKGQRVVSARLSSELCRALACPKTPGSLQVP